MHNLANMYLFGEGVTRNPKKAKELFLKAGLKNSYFNLSRMYCNGDGVKKDMSASQRYALMELFVSQQGPQSDVFEIGPDQYLLCEYG